MGGISIDSALQVGCMLCALWSGYQAVVHKFCLGQHSLTMSSPQMVINLYDKDPWKGPVAWDGKPILQPLANAFNVDSNGNPHKSFAIKPFGYHINWWQRLS
jgi:hypothetical protein